MKTSFEICEFRAVLPMPPTANNLFPTSKSGHRFPSKAYKAWQIEAAEWLKQRSVSVRQIPGKLRARYIFNFSDNRKRDIVNFEKAVTDLLVKHGVIADDSDIDTFILQRGEMAEVATVVVHIEPVKQACRGL